MARDNNYHSFRQPQSYRVGDVRREREIGDWGRASEHIGRRWEEIGLERLVLLLDTPVEAGPWARLPAVHRPHKAIPLSSDPNLQNSVTRLGLPSPDVVILLVGPDGNVLQPVDFKWDLEFASYDQIRAGTLLALLERDAGPLRSALSEAIGDGLVRPDCVDGLLFAPDRPANRQYLSSEINRRREYPVERHEVVFAPVTPQEFFAPLPGWPMALELAQRDRSGHSLEQLEGAERYYRLGAGLLGAIAKLDASVFEADPPPLDARTAMSWLETAVRAGHLNTINIVERVEQLMQLRAQRVARLKHLTKSPCRPDDLQRMAAGRGARRLQGEPPWDGWRELVKLVGAEHREAVVRAGAILVHQGMSDEEVLSRLEADLPRFHASARALAGRLVAGHKLR